MRKITDGKADTRILPLPVPEAMQGLLCDDRDAHRLTVAFGLSKPADLIPDSTLPGHIEDLHRPHRRSAMFVGPEQV